MSSLWSHNGWGCHGGIIPLVIVVSVNGAYLIYAGSGRIVIMNNDAINIRCVGEL
jgi:hypothetical protein